MATIYVDLINGVDAIKSITGASKANPCVITSIGHGMTGGETIFTWGIGGMTQINNLTFTVGSVSANYFELAGINSSAYTTFTVGGSCTPNGFTPSTPLKNPQIGCYSNGILDMRFAKTTPSYILSIPSNVTWTYNSTLLTTNTLLTASLSVGDYIGKTTAAGDGSKETFYRVNTIETSGITLDIPYFGTTETVSAIKIQPVVKIGYMSGSSVLFSTNNTTNNTFTGGWNLTASPVVQDGETWFGGNIPRTTVNMYGIHTNNTNTVLNISKINIAEVYTAHYGSTTISDGEIKNCTFIGYYQAILRTTAGFNVQINNNVLISKMATIVQIVYYSSIYEFYNNLFIGSGAYAAMSINYHKVNNNIFFKCSTAISFSTATPSVLRGINKFYYCGTGIHRTSGIIHNISSCEFYNCTEGTTNVVGNTVVSSCKFVNCTRGIYTVALGGGVYIKDCDFTNCGSSSTGIAGILLLQNHGSEIQNCNFYSCYKGVEVDQYSGDITLRNCNFETPTSVGVHRAAATAGTIYFVDCSIDPASINKYCSITTGYNTLTQYVLDNSFGMNGMFKGAGSKLTNNTVYRTQPPSLAIGWSTVTTSNITPMKVMSSMINSGVSARYGMYMKTTSPSWSGTIVPQWRLNGGVIKTESTTITAISSNWLPYSWSCLSSIITANGELALEFVPNMGTNYTVIMDDFTVA